MLPGAVVALVPARPPAPPGTPPGDPDWTVSGGKTQLAVDLAESLWRTGRIELMVWIVATDRASILSGLTAAAADTTGIAPSGDAELVAIRFMSWLSETDRPWLVVIDGLSEARDIEGLLPTGPSGRTLITAAHRSALPAGAPITTLPVPGLSRREGHSYLMGRLAADPGQRLGAIDLADQLEGDPFALTVATTLIHGTDLTCRDFLDRFTARWDQGRPAGSPAPAPGDIAWAMAAERADQLCPGGAVGTLLVLMALLNGNWIPLPVVTSTPVREHVRRTCGRTAPGEIKTALEALRRTGLVTLDDALSPAVVRMSRAVRAAVREAAPAEAFEQAAQVAAAGICEVWPDTAQYQWPAASMRAATFTIMRQSGDRLWSGGCHELLFRAGQSLEQARLDDAAVSYWTDLAAAGLRLLGPGHQDLLRIFDRLAGAILTAGQAARAIPWFQRVAAEREAQFGAAHPGSIQAAVNLGRALRAAGRASEAVSALSEAVADSENLRGSDHAETLRIRGELADAMREAGPPGQAIRLYRRTLAGRERILGATHPDTMESRQKLADAYLAGQQVKEALAQYKRLLSDRERASGSQHPQTIAARSGLAAANHAAGRIALALRLYEQADADSRRVLGIDHTETLTRNVNLAFAYYGIGRITDATALLEETVTRCERVLPPGASLTLLAQESLAKITGDR